MTTWISSNGGFPVFNFTDGVQSPLPTRYAEGEDDGPTGKEYHRQCEEHRKELYGCDAVIEGRKELQRSINKINIASGEDVCV